MNDITALMATMKSAAEKATPGEWCMFSHSASGTYAVHTPKDKRCEDVIKWPGFYGQENAEDNAEFIAVANPSNVKTLVEALEKAHRQIAQVTAERDALREGEIGSAKHSNTRAAADIYFQLAEECDIPAGGSLVEFVDGLKERLCVLESRTVTVNLPPRVDSSNVPFTAHTWNCCLDAVEKCLAAAGIQVIEGEG